MSQLQLWVVSYFLNSLWQVPVLCACGCLAARVLRPAGQVVEHRLWVTILLLQTLLPAASLLPWQWLQRFPWWSGQVIERANPQVSVAFGPGALSSGLHLQGSVIVAIVVLYGAVTGWFAARFVWRSSTISALRRDTLPLAALPEIAEICARCRQTFTASDVRLAASGRVDGPVTMGVWRKLILLPADLEETLSPEDLRTIIAHEFAHIHRHDFVKNLFYEVLCLPVAYHPLLWLTQARITESREMICDAMAAELDGKSNYARSLLRLARLLIDTPAMTPHTLGIFHADAFERRIMNLTQNQHQLSLHVRASLVAAAFLLAMGVSATALAVAVHFEPVSATGDSNPRTHKLSVSADEMAKHIITKAVPVYPIDAKKARIQGKVVLSIVIDKGGIVQQITAISGPSELQQSAIDTVRQWRYKPYLLNGDPVEVETTVNIIYSLAG